MARIRTVKPEFWEDEKIGKLPIPCRLFFIGCWNFADDFGVIKINAALLKSQIFPYDENLRVSEIKKWIDALVDARMLIPIIHKEESYYIIRTFRSHQIIDKRYDKSYISKDKSLVNELISRALKNDDVNTTSTLCHDDVNTAEEMEMEKEDNKETSPNGEEKKGELSFHSVSGNIDYNGLMNWYNELFKDKLPAIKSMTETRKKAVKARIAQYSKESVRTVFNLVLQSSFLLGGNDRNWKCDFDWIFKQANYTKILEGNYNGTRISKNQQDSEQRKRDSVLAVATTVREAAAKKRKELEAEGIIGQIP